MDTTRADTRQGVRDMLPMLVGYLPFAIVIGAAIGDHPDPIAAWAATWSIYGGAAQLAVLGGSSAGVAILTGLLINARLFVYSATTAGPWRGQPWWRRALASALLTDALWALAIRRYAEPGTDARRRRYYLGAGVTLWLGWLVMVTAAALGSRFVLPVDLALAAPLCLLALLGTTLRTRSGAAAAGAAAIVAVASSGWAGGAGLLIAVTAGVLSGLLVDRRAS